MYNKVIVDVKPLGFMWPTDNPFIFCVHHKDDYPKGNDEMGPAASLAGRYIGQDFTIKDGWRMYHGERIPGFPAHPHRGFETVTIVLDGFVDHSDSHGAAGRYGMGDVQWMTAGAGLQHCEMFPLVKRDARNPVELFQIWLNLSKRNKFADPHFKMLWGETIPELVIADENGKKTTVRIYAGNLNGNTAPAPAPASWAAEPENGVNIWTIKMEPGARFTLPPASIEKNRMLYYYQGGNIAIAGININPGNAVEMLADQAAIIECAEKEALFLFMEAMPINEPIVQHGPFVMNTTEEINQAFADYRRTQFGGWPWQRYDHVHPREQGRFARYKDGREESPGSNH